jgi:LssY C-terminus
MSKESFILLRRFLTVDYSPSPEERSFLERARFLRKGDVAGTVAVPSDNESQRLFGVRLARHSLQAVWLEVVNEGREPLWLDLVQLAPNYNTPLEVANVVRFALGKRLVAFGLLGWLFLPLLALLPLKLLSARAANRRLSELLRTVGFPTGAMLPGKTVKGFVFTPVDEGAKRIEVRLLGRSATIDFTFTVEVPGLTLPHAAPITENSEDFDQASFQRWLLAQPRCTANAHNTLEGDPLNLVVVGERADLQECLSAWDETESLTISTAWKTAKAFLLESQYRYSPVSPLYLRGRIQDLALQRARLSLNQRLPLRLWATNVRFDGKPVWIGQVSRDIGVRFTAKTWNLTTHQIDPDVDEARNYVLDDLLAAGRVSRFGFIPGVEAASFGSPRHNLTGDPYFTDGFRAVAVLAGGRTVPSLFSW